MFNAPDRKTAEEYLQAAIQKYAVSAPRLSARLEDNLSEGFSVFDFPLEHRRTIRTTNSLERIYKEIRRRTSMNNRDEERNIIAVLTFLYSPWFVTTGT